MRYATAMAAILAAPPLAAHEFWLEPDAYRIPADAQLEVRAYNGEFFDGIEYSYSARRWAQSGVVAGDQRARIGGDAGRKPAIVAPPAAEGLNIVFHASPVMSLTYPGMEKFEKFLAGKRLDAALEAHAAAGLPTEDIKESYFRYVKALVAVGDGAGEDRAVGLPYELVALANPYEATGDIPVQVLLDGASAPNAPVFVFFRTGGEGGSVDKLELTADDRGQVTIPRRPGEVMVNAVHIRRPSAEIEANTGAHWLTLWAALTYQNAD